MLGTDCFSTFSPDTMTGRRMLVLMVSVVDTKVVAVDMDTIGLDDTLNSCLSSQASLGLMFALGVVEVVTVS